MFRCAHLTEESNSVCVCLCVQSVQGGTESEQTLAGKITSEIEEFTEREGEILEIL